MGVWQPGPLGPTEGDDDYYGEFDVHDVDADMLGGDDTFRGGAGDDHVLGGDGSDILLGGEGDNFLDGGASNDRLEVGLGSNELYGRDGDDVIVGAGYLSNIVSRSFFHGGSGDDTLAYFVAGSQSVELYGEDGADGLQIGRPNGNILDGGAGYDLLTVAGEYETAQSQYVRYNAIIDLENDTLTAEGRVDTLVSIENVRGGWGDDIVIGDAGNSWLMGGPGDDLIAPGGGNDVVIGDFTLVFPIEGLFPTEIITAYGQDTVSYALASGPMNIHLSFHDVEIGRATDADGVDALYLIDSAIGSEFADIIVGSEDVFRLSRETISPVITPIFGFNHLEGLGGDDRLEGLSGRDFLEGGVGGDLLYGGLDRDRLAGGAGSDLLDGGDGEDIAVYSDALAGVQVVLGWNTPQDTLGDGVDTLVSIEGFEGSAFDDVLVGDGGVNFISGGSGNDWIVGGAGDDVLVAGEHGVDVLNGGDGIDTASFAWATEGVYVDVAGGVYAATNTWTVFRDLEVFVGGAGADTFFGSETADRLEGAAGTDALVGRAGNDSLSGQAGDDWLNGGSGDDILEGGSGANILIGGEGLDIVSYSYAGGDTWRLDIWLDMSVGVYSGGGAWWIDNGALVWDVFDASIEGIRGANGNDSIFGNDASNRLEGGGGADSLIGRLGDDTLVGDDGNDWLVGGDGDDRLLGGAGVDVLTAGAGADIFDLGANAGWDVAFDFNTSEDSFYLGGHLWSGFLTIDADGDGAADDTLLGYAGGNFVALNVAGLSLEQWNALVDAPPAGETGGEKLLSDPEPQTLPALADTGLSREMLARLFPESSLDLGPEAFRGFVPQHERLAIEPEMWAA